MTANSSPTAQGSQIELRLRSPTATTAVVQLRYGTGSVQTTTTVPISVLTHIAAVVHADDDLRLFINGVEEAAGGFSGGASGGDLLRIGANFSSAALFIGDVGEVGVWNAALSNDEVASLAAGERPIRLRPQKCTFYFPLKAPVVGFGGELTFSYAGPAKAALTESASPPADAQLVPMRPWSFDATQRSRLPSRGLFSALGSSSRLDTLVASAPILKSKLGRVSRIQTQIGVVRRPRSNG